MSEHDRNEDDRADEDETHPADRDRDENDWTTHDGAEKHDERRSDLGDEVTARDRIEYAPNPDARGRWLAAVVGAAGLLTLATATWFDLVAAQFWNDVLVGAVLLAVGAYNYYRRSNEEFGSAGAATLAAIVGLWLVASPFLIGPDSGPLAGTSEIGALAHVVVGLLAFAVGTYSAYTIRDRRRHADARPTATYDRRGH